MSDLGHTDVRIGQRRPGGLYVVVGQFRWAASGATDPAGSGESGAGSFADQTALESAEALNM